MNVLRLFKEEESAREIPRGAPDFAAFWAPWPRKVAKRDAERAWSKLTPADKTAALDALPQHVQHWRRAGTEPQYIPHPATWLNGARWEDEIQEAPAPKAKAPAGPPWWTSHSSMERKGIEVGVGPARAGESADQYRARIQAAIEDQLRFGSI